MRLPTAALLLALPLLVFLAGCSDAGTYEIKGRVAGFSTDPRTVIVEHEHVPGYMPAMTMPFDATSAEAVAALQRGDAIRFTLHVRRDSAWIDAIEQLPDDAVAAHPAGDAPPPPDGSNGDPTGEDLLAAGDALPAFRLVDQQGDTLRAADFEGQALALTFIYTRCPLPTYCPLMSERFRQIQGEIEERFDGHVRLLSISFDPDHDTPAVLQDYARRYDADPRLWHVATGTPATIDRLTRRFGVFVRQQDGPEGAFMHNLTTAVIGPSGHVRRIWHGDDWRTEDVLQQIDRALAPAS